MLLPLSPPNTRGQMPNQGYGNFAGDFGTDYWLGNPNSGASMEASRYLRKKFEEEMLAMKVFQERDMAAKKVKSKAREICGSPDHEPFIVRVGFEQAQCLACNTKPGLISPSMWTDKENEEWMAKDKARDLRIQDEFVSTNPGMATPEEADLVDDLAMLQDMDEMDLDDPDIDDEQEDD